MNLSEYEKMATGYYLLESMPDNVSDHWFRYICTDGINCKEVESDYQPTEEELVFACSITGGRTHVELYKKGT